MRLYRPFVTAAMAALAGCTAGADYERPALPPSPALTDSQFLRGRMAQDTAAPLAAWWKELDDPELDRLIEAGLANAPTIHATQARTRQARAGLAGARAALRPNVNASLAAVAADLPQDSFGSGSGDIELFLAGFDARWEIDLWGGGRRAVEQRRAEADAADALLADAQVQLSAEIARTYVDLRARKAVAALLARRTIIEDRISVLADQRFKAGTVPMQARESARQRLVGTLTSEQEAKAQVRVLRDALAVLTGSAPGVLDTLPGGAVPQPPRQAKVGDPAAMLERRPDIRAAERRLAAASAAIGVQKARRFPRISLLGLVGIGGSDANDVLEPSRLASIAAPQLSWNFLDFGRAAASVRGAEAARDAADADYDASVLAALQDAEAALTRFESARTTAVQRGAMTAYGRKIADLENQRARAGTLSQAGALEADVALVNAQIAEAESRAAMTSAFVALAKALGLGWDAGKSRE